ncbi:MAG TPA: adenylate/guanylate cyclase domain-containing protein [Noviherbaspirillum sp.]|jgi:adenylate cyclase|uniref:CHASE2 domain-containing protein n=1 Tax=Noviherbaspirillum sp. TaxID=1926288 RepID=UPI002DDCDB70|nr:adenylate/guanylate cyclase domain-containing protein [Noviherbaspirillum sp.]HEV2612671.1 adenylate/guanylate cyclase domain-containing protein [Noviherbaspirillum sp.]
MRALVLIRALLRPTALARLLIAATAVMLTVLLQYGALDDQAQFGNEWLRDSFIRVHASSEPESRVVVIDIDEASLIEAGPWPWPRSRLATLLETLISTYGVQGAALDLVLPEAADSEGDQRLAMLARHGPVVLAQALDYAPRSVPLQVGRIAGGTFEAASHHPKASGYIANHSGLLEARYTGNIGFVPDSDGTVRRLPTYTWFEGRNYPTLSLALFTCCHNGASAAIPSKDPFWRVPFSKDWSAYMVVSATDILNQRIPADAISGRLALIGSSSLGLSDLVTTPLTASTSGVMVHAAALSSLLDHRSGKSPAAWPGRIIAVLFAIAVAAVAAYSFPRLPAAYNVILLIGASLLWLLLAYVMAPHDADFSASSPLISNLFLLAVAVPFDWQLTQRRSQHLLHTLHQYVAKSVVDELMRSSVDDPLVPVHRDVTTLIADMEGYTGQVEALSVEEAAQLTRDFLDCLTRPVLARNGTLDKYTGDGLVAFWGAPLAIEEHADLALDAAHEILQEVKRFSLQREKEGKRALRVRIGIESGPAMAGDFGTSFRSIYTAVGDSVNVASRLQELARDMPHDLVVGKGTATRAKRHTLRFLGDIVLRGKEKPTTLYTLEQQA